MFKHKYSLFKHLDFFQFYNFRKETTVYVRDQASNLPGTCLSKLMYILLFVFQPYTFSHVLDEFAIYLECKNCAPNICLFLTYTFSESKCAVVFALSEGLDKIDLFKRVNKVVLII